MNVKEIFPQRRSQIYTLRQAQGERVWCSQPERGLVLRRTPTFVIARVLRMMSGSDSRGKRYSRALLL